MAMPYVVTRLCIDCLDRGCVEECPVECIYELREPTDNSLPRMAYIHPTECINCGACESACPWGAIFEDRELPMPYHSDGELNAAPERNPQQFKVAKPQIDSEGRLVVLPKPSREQVAANQAKWSKK
jgi:formate hydrogenlyase subunit 6/NADH:ubiquinone oxidoreductase subunit I